MQADFGGEERVIVYSPHCSGDASLPRVRVWHLVWHRAGGGRLASSN